MKHLDGRASSVVSAPLATCFAVLAAVDRYPSWSEFVREVVDVERDDDGRPLRAHVGRSRRAESVREEVRVRRDDPRRASARHPCEPAAEHPLGRRSVLAVVVVRRRPRDPYRARLLSERVVPTQPRPAARRRRPDRRHAARRSGRRARGLPRSRRSRRHSLDEDVGSACGRGRHDGLRPAPVSAERVRPRATAPRAGNDRGAEPSLRQRRPRARRGALSAVGAGGGAGEFRGRRSPPTTTRS